MELFYYLHIIVTIVLVALLGVSCGAFSYFLDYCFWPGSVFKFYLPFLARTVLPKSERKEVELLEKSLRANEYVHRAENYMLFKLLGGCMYCFNVWITFISFSLLPFEWYYIFIYTPAAHFFLRKIGD